MGGIIEQVEDKYYFKLNENNIIIGAYIKGINEIPENAIAVNEDIWNQRLQDSSLNAFVDGKLCFKDTRTQKDIELEQHQQKSNLVDEYVNNLIITTTSNKRFKARYSDLSSMDIILKSEYPNGVIPIWKQNINGELVYYENLPLSELSEVINEANKRIQAKHAEVFLGIENPYNEVENEI